MEEMMLVEYMSGNEYTIDLLADKGKVLYEVGRENIVSLMSIAQESILAYDETAYHIASEVVSLLNMDGNVGFDFMRNADGVPVLMDINPRLTTTVSVIAAGGSKSSLFENKTVAWRRFTRMSCSIWYTIETSLFGTLHYA